MYWRITLLCLLGAIGTARADLCAARSGRNARAVTGCPSVGFTGLTRTRARSDRLNLTDFMLAIDGQAMVGPVLLRGKGLVSTDAVGTVSGLGLGAAWLARVTALDLMLNLGGEYAPPLASAARIAPTLPALQHYFTPDTHHLAAQGSLGWAQGDLEARIDADLIAAIPSAGDAYALTQLGATLAWSPLSVFGLRLGCDLYWAEDDGIGDVQAVITPGVHVFTRLADVGVGVAHLHGCQGDGGCWHVIADLTLPLGRQ